MRQENGMSLRGRTTDFRLVLSEVVSQYLGNHDLKDVFPGFEGQPGQFLKLLGQIV